MGLFLNGQHSIEWSRYDAASLAVGSTVASHISKQAIPSSKHTSLGPANQPSTQVVSQAHRKQQPSTQQAVLPTTAEKTPVESQPRRRRGESTRFPAANHFRQRRRRARAVAREYSVQFAARTFFLFFLGLARTN